MLAFHIPEPIAVFEKLRRFGSKAQQKQFKYVRFKLECKLFPDRIRFSEFVKFSIEIQTNIENLKLEQIVPKH